MMKKCGDPSRKGIILGCATFFRFIKSHQCTLRNVWVQQPKEYVIGNSNLVGRICCRSSIFRSFFRSYQDLSLFFMGVLFELSLHMRALTSSRTRCSKTYKCNRRMLERNYAVTIGLSGDQKSNEPIILNRLHFIHNFLQTFSFIPSKQRVVLNTS